MGTTPSSVNSVANTIDGIVQSAITGGEQAAQAYITTQVPWLEWPVISIFTNAIIGALGKSIYTQTSALVANVVIDVQVNLEKSAVASAIAQMKQAQVSGDPNDNTKANAAFDSAVAGLIHFTGSATS